MERPDRMPAGMGAGPGAAPGPPAAQPALRGIGVGMATPDNNNPAQTRRPLLTTAPSNGQMPPMMPLPPLPNSRNGPPPNATSPATPILTPAQVISLTREAMRHALENESQAVDVGPGLKSGVTIDLSRKGIQKLPEEVVDIVKNELERLALSHNQLSSLPARFAECVSLRYLNIRGNQIKEFPLPLCELKSLEILDLGRNQLRVLPPDIARLSSLKVLSIPKNQIRELPVCLAEMTSLQVLKFEGNPISFPPRDALQIQSPSPSGEGSGREGEVTEVAITAHIKKFMKLHLINGRDAEATGDESSEGTDTPRMPLRRMPSGRFPIKVSSSDASDMRVPSGGPRGPPPIPSRSHYRGLSQQNTATRRPGVLPLTIGNIAERGRSNSETLMHSERSNSRQRRMGILAKKATSDLGTLDEVEGSNRWSHYRGLSHGSAMQGNQAAPSRSPATPTDSLQRPVYVRRLSVLPERRRESKVVDPVIEAAKGILYSVFQIHPMIQMLMTLTNDGSAKRSSLEIVFYNTNSHVEELEQEIQKHDMAMAEDEEGPFGDNANVHRACQTLVGAYGHVCTLLADNIDTFVNNGDARYIRTLLMLIYNSIMELRVTLSSVFSENTKQTNVPALDAPDNSNTIKPYFREAAAAVPAPQKPAPPRNRSGPAMHNPSNLRVATDIPVPYNNGGSRTAKLVSATPRSNDSFASSYEREGAGPDFSEEDAQFDKIYLALQRSTDIVLHILPNFHTQLTGGIRNAMQQRAPSAMIRDWKNLIAMCVDAIQQTEILKNRLSLIKLKDPGVRSHAGFWSLCSNFISAWTKMASKIKSEINTIPLPPDTRARLRPVHQSMKETSIIIMNSPWNYILRPAGSGGSGGSGGGGGGNGGGGGGGHGGGPQGSFGPGALSPTTPQVPITPQSAALGPAMQATVATPQTGSFAAVFHGNVFERAETLMTNPGISMSRTGTMAKGHSGFNSLSSVSSMSSDGVPTPSSAFSPSVQVASAPFRVNGGKVAI